MVIYPHLEIAITLRCNAACRNCIRCCNMGWTGLDYSQEDMTLSDVTKVLLDIRHLGWGSIGELALTGGEPFLHPHLEEIFDTVIESGIGPTRLLINTNGTMPILPKLAPHVVHWWDVGREKAANHQAMFVDPAARGERVARATCEHYHKDRIVATKRGYLRCCASEGYTRLFGYDDLFLDYLPRVWPNQNQDRVCAHCAYGSKRPMWERDVGAPIDDVYRLAVERRKACRYRT